MLRGWGKIIVLYQTAQESKEAGIAYHLTPRPVWDSQKDGVEYFPEAFEQDKFIHATNGLDRLQWVANEFYTSETRSQTVLVLNVDRIASPVRYDDEKMEFPHIYGPLNTDAVVGELEVLRAEDGSYSGFREPRPGEATDR